LPERRSCSHNEPTSVTPTPSIEELAGALRQPEAYPRGAGRVEFGQTQMSLLFFVGDVVYKVKKPVDLGYLNYSTLDARKGFCEREVELNRRLCPDIYLGVVPITRSGGTFQVEGTGEPVEYAVKMRRLPQELMLDHLLATGAATPEALRTVAVTLASFHGRTASTPAISAFGSIETIRGNTDENFAQTRPYIGRTMTESTHHLLKSHADGFLASHRALLDGRVRDGRIRDCHGDLHAAHVCLTDPVCIYDCIEFNDRFRYGDVASEVAFLAMDLDRCRRHDLSRAFVDSYVASSGDVGVDALLPFYTCYRAVVRGKVEGFKLGDPLIPAAEQRATTWLSRTYFELARRYATGRGQLVVMSGLTGSGKSVVAERLGALFVGTVIASDVVRKQLAGLPPEEHRDEPFGQGLYSPEWTQRTYDELLRRAAAVLADGGCAILDASFLRTAERSAASALARRTGARLLLVECTAPHEVLLERLRRRREAGTISDGRPEILDGQVAAREPVSGMSPEEHLHADTTRDIDGVMEELWARS
jgi:uncharacterized protein